MSKDEKLTTKVIIPCRFSYLTIFKPRAINDGDDPKYSVCALIPKSDTKTIAKIEKAIENAKILGKTKLGGKIPSNLKVPLRDGDVDRPDDEVYADHMFINCNSPRKPGIVNADLEEIIDESEIYSGAYGRVSVNFYAYNVGNGTSKGIGAGLNNIQMLKDGERLGGGASAEEDFGSDLDDLM